MTENSKDIDERLLTASYNGDLRETLECITDGADVNAYDWSDGRFPLLHAAERGHVEVAQALLATGRVNLKDNDGNGNNAISMALKFEDLVKGRDNKKRYSMIANLIWGTEGGFLPEMPTLKSDSTPTPTLSAAPSPKPV